MKKPYLVKANKYQPIIVIKQTKEKVEMERFKKLSQNLMSVIFISLWLNRTKWKRKEVLNHNKVSSTLECQSMNLEEKKAEKSYEFQWQTWKGVRQMNLQQPK